jgi:uncharacterized protein (TIGR02147 family)
MITIDIYKYDDYRIFLNDSFTQKQKDNPLLSHRKFAAEAGFTNPGFLNDVIKGKRTLSDQAVEKMINVFSLSLAESEYFRLLVLHNQSKKEDERNEHYKKLLFRRNRSNFTRLNPSLAKYYQDYRYPLVRSAIEACDFRGDYELLSRFLDPPIPSHLIKKYVRDLCAWDMVRQDTDGKYTVTSKLLEPPETLLHLVRELNKEWIMHAYGAIGKFPKEKRNISTMVLSVSEKTYKEIQEKIEKLREEIFALAEAEKHPDRVAQLSIQLFPKSCIKEISS